MYFETEPLQLVVTLTGIEQLDGLTRSMVSKYRV